MLSLQRKEILIIDGAEEFRQTARRILESDGARVLDTPTVEEGTALALEKHPHLIITELKFPIGDGFTFLEKRKQVPSLRNTPVLVVSELKDPKSVYRATALGASGYILKPIQASMLLQKIKKTLQASTFHVYRFEPSARPQVTATLSAKILRASETGFVVESPIKMGTESNVKLAAAILDKMKAAQMITRTTNAEGRFLGRGRYINDVALVGLDEPTARVIRNVLKGLT